MKTLLVVINCVLVVCALAFAVSLGHDIGYREGVAAAEREVELLQEMALK